MDELLETDAIEMPSRRRATSTSRPRGRCRRPSTRPPSCPAWKGEVRTAAIAAAGGLVAGAATVAARARHPRRLPSGRRSASARPTSARCKVLASRSFLVDVHLLDK